MASATQVVCVPKLMMENAFSGQFWVDVRPTVGRSPTMPHSAEGTRTEPPPSMPAFSSSHSEHQTPARSRQFAATKV